MNYVDISLDLETWGTDPGDDIRSIGAVVFNLNNPDVPSEFPLTTADHADPLFYYACENPEIYISGDPKNKESWGRKYNLKRNPKTEQWWADQPEDARAAFKNPIDLKEALIKLTQFIGRYSRDIRYGQAVDVRIWTHGKVFDLPILAAAYQACDLLVPWYYRAPRDTRTAFDFGRVGDHTEWLKAHNCGTLHHALYDAISQAKAITHAYQRTRFTTEA
jgi:hypothetical protein